MKVFYANGLNVGVTKTKGSRIASHVGEWREASDRILLNTRFNLLTWILPGVWIAICHAPSVWAFTVVTATAPP